MSAVDAALVHKRVFTDELHSKFKIGCPSVSSSKQWLVVSLAEERCEASSSQLGQDFNAACDGGCNYDFIPMAVHHTKAEAAISLIVSMRPRHLESSPADHAPCRPTSTQPLARTSGSPNARARTTTETSAAPPMLTSS